MRLLAGSLIVIVIVFGALEISRWRRPDLAGVLTTTQKSRRVVGLLILLMLGLMAYGGASWPSEIIGPPLVRRMVLQFELIYWLFFALLTCFVPLIAFFEMKDSLLRASELRRETYREIVTSPLDKLSSDDHSDKKNLP